MNLVTIEHLTKSYTERLLFDDTAFSPERGGEGGADRRKRHRKVHAA